MVEVPRRRQDERRNLNDLDEDFPERQQKKKEEQRLERILG
jgi:hypothetical protein